MGDAMLLQIEIKNFAIIEHSILDISTRFGAITGETGSGKSILFKALSFVLGERSSKEYIRKGESSTFVRAVFSCSEKLQKELELEEDLIILSREMQENGKSIAKLNERIITAQTLRNLRDKLIEISSQKDQSETLQSQRYLSYFDMNAPESIKESQERYRENFTRYQEVVSQLHELHSDHREQMQLLDLYRYQAEEIQNANLTLGEDETLAEEKQFLASAEKISNQLQKAIYNFQGLEALQEASSSLRQVSSIHQNLETLSERFDSAFIELEDVCREISSFQGTIEYDEEKLNQIISRLELISGLKRKYGNTIEEILEHEEQARTKLHQVENKDEWIENLEKEKKQLEEVLEKEAKVLHNFRLKEAKQLEIRIQQELHSLCMPNAYFHLSFSYLDHFTANGKSDLNILFSANKGEDPKPLHKTASGGELSRVLLALKIASSKEEENKVLIFDEVDEGVGGEVGRVIGEKLRSLSETHQVVVISHLPQVAAKADEHFAIRKEVIEDRTISKVIKIKENEREKEIARMIYGDHVSETTLQQAREMLL